MLLPYKRHCDTICAKWLVHERYTCCSGSLVDDASLRLTLSRLFDFKSKRRHSEERTQNQGSFAVQCFAVSCVLNHLFRSSVQVTMHNVDSTVFCFVATALFKLYCSLFVITFLLLLLFFVVGQFQYLSYNVALKWKKNWWSKWNWWRKKYKFSGKWSKPIWWKWSSG